MTSLPREVDTETGEILEGSVAAVPAPAVARDMLVRLVAPIAEIEQAMKDYQELCKRLLDESDYQKIGQRDFKKKSAWRKLSVAFSVSFEIKERLILRADDGRVNAAEFVVTATAPNGRAADAYGSCDRWERCCEPGCSKSFSGHRHCPAAGNQVCLGWTHFSHANHDIPATAETRAKNRAAADLFGMGEASAEEVGDEPPHAGETKARKPKAATKPATQADVERLRTLLLDEGVGVEEIEAALEKRAAEQGGKLSADYVEREIRLAEERAAAVADEEQDSVPF